MKIKKLYIVIASFFWVMPLMAENFELNKSNNEFSIYTGMFSWMTGSQKKNGK